MQPSEQALQDSQKMAYMAELLNLTRRVRNGASNFYWIAGLSVINSLIAIFGGGTRFVIGLGITSFVDYLAIAVAQEVPDASLVIQGIGFVIGLFINGIIAIFGYFAAKNHRWAFITGMVLYSLDALLVMYFQDWIGFGFHLLFLWGIFNGLQALNKLKAFQTGADALFPKADIGG